MDPVKIDFNCPHCEHHIELDESSCGKSINCPKCGEEIIIPEKPKISAKIAAINFVKSPYTFRRDDRVAQMVIHSVCQPFITVVESLEETDRNGGGFGHTGK